MRSVYIPRYRRSHQGPSIFERGRRNDTIPLTSSARFNLHGAQSTYGVLLINRANLAPLMCHGRLHDSDISMKHECPEKSESALLWLRRQAVALYIADRGNGYH